MKKGSKSPAELPILPFESPEEWNAWLEAHHASSPGIWLMFAKKGSDIPSVTYAEAVDVALCHGWIDGQKKANDASTWLQKFTPRGTRSIWSKINRDKVEKFISDGLMRPAGLATIERAKQNGQWDAAYDSPSKAVVPDDFQSELDRHPKALAFFATLNSANRYALTFRIQTAKKAETRARKIQEFIRMLENGEKFH
ncbi:MAG: YdeI/OmpD-associated family protein [Bacteroidota bacterium]